MSRRPKTEPHVAVAYLRISTTNKGQSTDRQRDAISDYAARMGLTVASWREDQMSGASPVLKRRGFLGALMDAAEHRAGVLLIAERDRLCRSVEEAVGAELAARKVGARIVSADGTTDDSPTGRLLRHILDAVAEFELELTRARVTATRAARAARGQASGGSAPIGKRWVDGKLVDASYEERRVVDKIRELHTGGMSVRAIAARLNASDVFTPRGQRWHATTVARVLRRHASTAIAS